MKLDTKVVQLGQEPGGDAGGVVPPIHMSTTYDQRAQDPLRFFYGRGENPTREALERCLAGLEDAKHALVFSSGQAAGMSILSLFGPGDEVVASDDIYGGSYELLSVLGPRLGLEVRYVDWSKPDLVAGAFGPKTKLVWIETPTNPLLKIADIAAIAARAGSDARVVVDNTFATAYLQQPLALGAAASLYSTTKFVCGHSDAIGGALVLNDDAWRQRLFHYRTTAGNVPSPFDCWLIHRGVKTLSVRMARQQENARKIVAFLRSHPAVSAVYFPDVEGHARADVLRRQMRGPGAVISFEHRGDSDRLMQRLELFACAVSLGSVRSLIERPATMTHRPVPRDVRLALGIGDDLLRIAVGIEDGDDLVDDLRRGLG